MSADIEIGSPEAGSPEAGSPNTVTERIDFRKNSIDRTLPTLLSDNGKMTVMVWESFCDKIDDALKPLGRIKMVVSVFWGLVFLMVIVMSTAEEYAAEYRNIVYGIATPIVFGCASVACCVEGKIRDRVGDAIANICASTSNHDRDLTLKLNSDTSDVKYWFIAVTLRNVHVGESMTLEGKPVEELVPSAYASPIVETTATATAEGGPAPAEEAPKKYIKDPQGNLSLNPEYKDWMKQNYG